MLAAFLTGDSVKSQRRNRGFFNPFFLFFQVLVNDRGVHVHRRHVHEQLVLRAPRHGHRRHHLQVHRVQGVSLPVEVHTVR